MADVTGTVIYTSGDKTIRYATAADYNNVVAINDIIYEGLDYIPDKYFYYLYRPGTHCFVMIIKDQVVALLMITLIDEGKSLLVQANRLKPHLGHNKYALFFTGVTALHICMKNPQVTNVVGIAKLELDNLYARQSILKITIITFELNTLIFQTRDLYRISLSVIESDIWPIEGEVMRTWLLTHGKTFFPEYIPIEYCPLQYLPGNIDIIVDEMKPVCFISNDQKDKHGFSGVSFHVTHGTLRRGVVCIFHYYADDIINFEKHLKHHLNYLKVNKKVSMDEVLHLHFIFQQVFSHSDVTHIARKFSLLDGLIKPAILAIQKLKNFEKIKQISSMLSKL